MKDFFQQELKTGDIVAFNPPYYKGLTQGTVLNLTPKGVRVKYIHQGRPYDCAVFGRDVVKAPQPIVVSPQLTNL